jgi:peptidoglycan hydrolase-like protein with peptidoglycan-binding domain
MQNLKLQTPPMTGSDVSAWQQFLSDQGFLTGAVDGVFGPATSEATKNYQAARGLTADGIVGPGTMAQAGRDGFQSAPGGTAIAGMDTNVSCLDSIDCIKAAGMKYVFRYYAQNAAKRLTREEAVALSQAGLQLGVVYEDFNNSIDRFSAAIGKQQVQAAVSQAAAVGQPSGSAIYFAVDFDPSEAQVRGAVTEYFQAVSDALAAAPAPYAIGVYGSGLTCRILRDSGLATLTWLTGSTGFREYAQFKPQATLVQIAPARKICGGALEIDDDIAQTAIFGQFQFAVAAT